MQELTVLDGVAVALVWLVVLYRWWRQPSRPFPHVAHPPAVRPETLPFVSIIVPARNEAHHIEPCVRSLLAQDYPRFEVIVVDDCSEDDTGALLAELARGDRRLTVVTGAPLPQDWMGKAHAIHQGYQRARGEWLLFTDADTVHGPALLRAVLAHVLHEQAAYATVFGDQVHPTIGAYLANVGILAYLFLVMDPKSWTNPRSRQSLVNGQYVLFSREAYEAIGTHAAVRRYSSTDVTLGYLAKMNGWPAVLIDGRGALATSMYRDFTDAFQGWSRSLVNGAWTALGPSFGSLALVAVTGAMMLFWIGPWVSLAWSLVAVSGPGVVVSGALLGGGLSLLRLAREPWLPTIGAWLILPVSTLVFATMAGAGLIKAWVKGGTVWKGRTVRTARRLPPWSPRRRRDPLLD